MHTQVRFHRPKTLKLERKPQFLRRSALLKPRAEKLDKYDIIRHPLSTEKAMQKMENENTMVFIVDNRANKHMIKKAFEKLYSVKIRSVNTLNRPDGKKKAYIRLSADNDLAFARQPPLASSERCFLG